ncbi:hypothetical protein PROFUN_09558 [Planoprotostelium fungivorum]|uniref:Uncharacterized protein n=1 Tax=Planoprotostelium fungivorum TaxID=1890364 RepID=A0A2P6MT30_9EUKA|nr:hypothetical protein PROFUN_09558 [Planoprotostelium fungivorum]
MKGLKDIVFVSVTPTTEILLYLTNIWYMLAREGTRTTLGLGFRNSINVTTEARLRKLHKAQTSAHKQDHPQSSTMADLTLGFDRTEAFDSVLCLSQVYPLHITTAYLATLSGIFAIATRIIPRFHSLHRWFGRAFLISLLWASGSSILIINHGLPKIIILFLALMLVFLTIGVIVISIDQARYQKELRRRVDDHFATKGHLDLSVSQVESLLAQEMKAEKTWTQRLFSLKALHGACMVVAWYQMFGRAAVTNPYKEEYKCWTYPVAKNGTGDLHYLPRHDPHYKIDDPVRFAIMVTGPLLVVIPTVGIIWSYLAARRDQKLKYTYTTVDGR